MLCRQCGYPDSQVVETKRDDIRNQIIRRRECIKCGVRYTTQESIHASRPNYVTPKPRGILEK
jgi:transcriptional regulator NrdR family protein